MPVKKFFPAQKRKPWKLCHGFLTFSTTVPPSFHSNRQRRLKHCQYLILQFFRKQLYSYTKVHPIRKEYSGINLLLMGRYLRYRFFLRSVHFVGDSCSEYYKNKFRIIHGLFFTKNTNNFRSEMSHHSFETVIIPSIKITPIQ